VRVIAGKSFPPLCGQYVDGAGICILSGDHADSHAFLPIGSLASLLRGEIGLQVDGDKVKIVSLEEADIAVESERVRIREPFRTPLRAI
jgi:hypothetical protein